MTLTQWFRDCSVFRGSSQSRVFKDSSIRPSFQLDKHRHVLRISIPDGVGDEQERVRLVRLGQAVGSLGLSGQREHAGPADHLDLVLEFLVGIERLVEEADHRQRAARRDVPADDEHELLIAPSAEAQHTGLLFRAHPHRGEAARPDVDAPHLEVVGHDVVAQGPAAAVAVAVGDGAGARQVVARRLVGLPLRVRDHLGAAEHPERARHGQPVQDELHGAAAGGGLLLAAHQALVVLSPGAASRA
jgi:hypothetical protein